MKRIAFSASGYNKQYLLTHPWELVEHYWNQLRYFVQRGLYGYADEDWWSINYYLSQWLPSAIRKVGTGHGYPGRGTANTAEKWKAICEKMAKGFEAHYKIQDKFPKKPELERLQKVEAEGMKLFIKWFGNLWD